MDRRLECDERKEVGWLHTERAARIAPRLEAGNQLAEELHRSLGSSRATRLIRSGNARRNDRMPER